MTTMENRPLKLHIVKGPRQGEELEFKPGSRIRIGRVVRGNNVAIKDAGISTKHLSIELDPTSGTWILQDVGSSNGTLINGSSNVLSPNTPYSINDGDSIKIGESTTILVRLDSCVVEVSELPPNPRRRGRPAAGRRNLKEDAATGVFKESEGLKEAEEEESVKAAGVSKETLGLKEADEIVKDAGVLKDSRVDLTSSTLMKEVENINPEKDIIVQAPRVSPRRTRGRKKKGEDGIGKNNCEEKKSNLGERTRASSKGNQNEDKDVKKLKTVVVAADNVNVEVSNLEEETGQPDQMCNEKKEDLGGIEKKGNKSSAANGHPDEGKPGRTLDLEKLTVREVFDILEAQLRREIIEETNKSLAAMRAKVERVKDYIREQRRKNSGQQPAA